MKLKDLAAHLGLSQTTVSRALNGHDDVNADTRRRIVEAAERLGYTANANARRLATGRANTVGIVLRDSQSLGTGLLEFIGGFGDRLGKDGIDILLGMADSQEAELAFYRRSAASKRVDGVVLHGPIGDDPRPKILDDLGLPFVLHGRTGLDRPMAYFDIDNEGAFRRATSYLLDLGHRRIALVNGPEGLTFAEHREAGYRAALAARGVEPVEAFVVNGPFSDEVGFGFAQAMLARQTRPTAFLAGSMTSALGILRAIRTEGLVVPRDVSIVVHDDVFPFLNADVMVPPLSTTRSPIRAAGIRIAEMMIQLLAGAPAVSLQEVWQVDLVLRDSTAPPPGEGGIRDAVA